jgi:hypothetical protein
MKSLKPDQVPNSMKQTTVFKIFIQNLHWLSGNFFENPFMCRIPWHLAFVKPCLFWTATHAKLWVYYSLQLKFLWHFTFKILCKFFLPRSEYLFMVSKLDFYTVFIYCSSTVSQSTPLTSIYRAKWWRPRGARRLVENLSAAHSTDLGPEEPVPSKGTNSPYIKWMSVEGGQTVQERGW